MRVLPALAAAIVLSAPAPAYNWMTYSGGKLHRSPVISFSVSPAVRGGWTNRDGRAMITAESDPQDAIRRAAAAWSSIPTSAVSLTINSSEAGPDPRDRVNTISFDDTPETRSIVGDALAVTMVVYDQTGEIVDSDIHFNPDAVFATIPTLGAFDLQAVATHEMGHTLGAGHSFLISAVMMQAGEPEATQGRYLTSDDIALMTVLHPGSGAGERVGRITGRAAFESGEPVRSAMVVAVDASTGFIASRTSGGDGVYTIAGLPPGAYHVFIQPVPAFLSDFGAPDPIQGSGWQAEFAADGEALAIYTVAGGAAVENANIVVPDGPALVTLEFAIGGISGGLIGGTLPSGGPVHLVVAGSVPEGVRPEDVVVLGPGVEVRSASLQPPAIMELTLDVTARQDWAGAVIALRSGGRAGIYAGLRIRPAGISLAPSGVVHAATFMPGLVSPGEIVSIFGSGLLREISFDGVPAPVFYASAEQVNAQVPYEVAGRLSTRIRTGEAEVIVPVAAASPAIFERAILNQDDVLNTADSPAGRGTIVVAYGTGLGAVTPALATGELAPAVPLSRAAGVTATIGGMEAPVHFAGMTPGFAGLFQLNVEVPAGAQPGAHGFHFKVGDIPAAWTMPVYVK